MIKEIGTEKATTEESEYWPWATEFWKRLWLTDSGSGGRSWTTTRLVFVMIGQ